ncbi:hypothetical protein DSECCO2_425030 [anaerobic digester metagenome]
MRFHDLADVHARRHAQGVQDDVHGGAVGEERHVLFRQDVGHDALVAVTAGHLVADVELAFHGHVNLGHLDHAGGQIVSLGDLATLVLVDVLDEFELQVEVIELVLDRLVDLLGGEGTGELLQRDLGEHVFPDGLVRFEKNLALALAHDGLGHALALAGLPDLATGGFGQGRGVLTLADVDAFEFVVLDLAGALVLVAGAAVEDLHVDDRALDSRRDLEGRVLHVARLVAEDGPQQAFLGSELRLALGRDLADEDVVGFDLGADADDAALVEVAEHLLADVGDVAGHFLGSELGVAGKDVELLDVDGGVDVLLHDALGNEDGVLVVVAAPGHEGHQQVLAKGQLAVADGGPVGQDHALADLFADLNARLLAEAAVLV